MRAARRYCGLKRSARKGDNSKRDFPVVTRSTTTSPRALQYLKPCPLRPTASQRFWWPGKRSTTKSRSGGVLKERGPKAHDRAVRLGEIAPQEHAEYFLFLRLGLDQRPPGLHDVTEEKFGELESRNAMDGQPVEMSEGGGVDDPGGHARGPEKFRRLFGLKPANDLPLRFHGNGKRCEHPTGPGTARHHQRSRLVGAAVGRYAIFPSMLLPVQHGFMAVEFRPRSQRDVQAGLDGEFGEDEAGAGLIDGHHLGIGSDAGNRRCVSRASMISWARSYFSQAAFEPRKIGDSGGATSKLPLL